MKHVIKSVGLALTLALTGCAGSIEGEQYVQQSPKFDLYSFFDGKVKAWGIAQGRSGEIKQRFTVDINGRVEGEKLILDESFTYSLGEGPTERVWEITPAGTNRFNGKAGDILGTAEGISYGNAFNFSYKMDLPVDDTTYEVGFDDWFFAMDDNTMMNRSYITKFGVVVAEVTIFMQKQ